MNTTADQSIDAYLDMKFKGSLRMPLAVWVDRENVRDWLAFEVDTILMQGITDKKKAERWSLARFEGSAALKSALIPEQDMASPGPPKRRVIFSAVLMVAFIALLCWNLTLDNPPVWIALAMPAALIGSHTLLIAAAERILTLRVQRTDGMIALIATLGFLGWAIYVIARYLPERRAQKAVIERLLR